GEARKGEMRRGGTRRGVNEVRWTVRLDTNEGEIIRSANNIRRDATTKGTTTRGET
ncbi:hypothetical protein EAI_01845, partial [Harpegnathos saltator]